jgi:hypothetical protein
LLAVSSLAPSSAWAQKIIHIKGAASGVFLTSVRVHKFGRVTRGRLRHTKRFRKTRFRHKRFSAFSLPDQTLYPPYYAWPQPYAKGPDMASRIKGGKTVEQGSIWRSRIEGGKTVEQGSQWGSHIKGGRTVEGGSRWASRIVAGRTVEGGSKWGSTMPNWRFTGYAAPMRPRGITYYRTKRRTRSPWASRLR